MNCTTCREILPDLLFEPGFVPGPDAAAHLDSCPECRAELQDLRATLDLMNEWTAPEPTPYFDSRVRAHVRAAANAQPEGLWERLTATLRFSTGRGLRPALAGAFLFILLLGGGTVASLWDHFNAVPATSSPAVDDLRIFDNNAQAIQQMDLLDDGSDSNNAAPQT